MNNQKIWDNLGQHTLAHDTIMLCSLSSQVRVPDVAWNDRDLGLSAAKGTIRSIGLHTA